MPHNYCFYYVLLLLRIITFSRGWYCWWMKLLLIRIYIIVLILHHYLAIMQMMKMTLSEMIKEKYYKWKGSNLPHLKLSSYTSFWTPAKPAASSPYRTGSLHLYFTHVNNFCSMLKQHCTNTSNNKNAISVQTQSHTSKLNVSNCVSDYCASGQLYRLCDLRSLSSVLVDRDELVVPFTRAVLSHLCWWWPKTRWQPSACG